MSGGTFDVRYPPRRLPPGGPIDERRAGVRSGCVVGCRPGSRVPDPGCSET